MGWWWDGFNLGEGDKRFFHTPRCSQGGRWRGRLEAFEKIFRSEAYDSMVFLGHTDLLDQTVIA